MVTKQQMEELIIEVKEDIAVIKSHVPQYAKIIDIVARHEETINQTKGAVGILKWSISVLLIPMMVIVIKVFY